MLSAAQYLEAELTRKERGFMGAGGSQIMDARETQAKWTAEDWYDFAERYADFVCDFEKQIDRQKSGTLRGQPHHVYVTQPHFNDGKGHATFRAIHAHLKDAQADIVALDFPHLVQKVRVLQSGERVPRGQPEGTQGEGCKYVTLTNLLDCSIIMCACGWTEQIDWTAIVSRDMAQNRLIFLYGDHRASATLAAVGKGDGRRVYDLCVEHLNKRIAVLEDGEDKLRRRGEQEGAARYRNNADVLRAALAGFDSDVEPKIATQPQQAESVGESKNG